MNRVVSLDTPAAMVTTRSIIFKSRDREGDSNGLVIRWVWIYRRFWALDYTWVVFRKTELT